MAQGAVKHMINKSPYFGTCFVIATKHSKSIALSPPLERILGAGVLEYVVDTDTLGTFSGEIERKGSALDCARTKCEWSIKKTNVDYALASEGSFGSHPFIPYLPSNREILYFIDRIRNFHLHVTDITSDTNYQMKDASSFEELYKFAENALFPAHALIISPFPRAKKDLIFKGIENKANLEAAFLECKKASPDNQVWVETDMRADFNPTRMKFIGALGEKLAHRLNCECPDCGTPGWGLFDINEGLPCRACGSPTGEIKEYIFGCTKCKYKEKRLPENAHQKADPGQCSFCNP